jgi:hypothetical protein
VDTPQRCSIATALATLLMASAGLHAQVNAPASTDAARDSVPSLRCYRGQPAPACHTFVITELGYYPAIWSTSSSDPRYVGDSSTFRLKDFGTHGEFELGNMRNRGANSAVGATVVIGVAGHGMRYGAKVRYRRWLTREGLSADLAAGVVSGTFREFDRTAILTTDVALNFADYGALVSRFELAHARGRTESAVYGGARLGSKPGLVATVLTAIGALAVYLALSSLFSNE